MKKEKMKLGTIMFVMIVLLLSGCDDKDLPAKLKIVNNSTHTITRVTVNAGILGDPPPTGGTLFLNKDSINISPGQSQTFDIDTWVRFSMYVHLFTSAGTFSRKSLPFDFGKITTVTIYSNNFIGVQFDGTTIF